MENKDPSKTEEPTGKRIEEARADGNVMMSDEINSVAVLLIGTLVLIFFTFPSVKEAFYDTLMGCLAIDCRSSWSDAQVTRGGFVGAVVLAKLLLPAMFFIALATVIAVKAQIGSYYSTKALEWKFDALMPNFKTLIPSQANMVRLGLTTLKVGAISLFVYWTVKGDLEKIVALPMDTLSEAMYWILGKIAFLVFKILAFLVVIAAIDYTYKHIKYYVDLRMTREEVKDERKNSEGDPKIKAEIRKRMMMMLARIIAQVPRADVVVTNPTHVAVALKYEAGMPAPRVLAKGLRKRAMRIKMIAYEHGVPIVENPPLARGLYRSTKTGGFIQPQFFGAVAAVLAKLHRAGIRRFKLS